MKSLKPFILVFSLVFLIVLTQILPMPQIFLKDEVRIEKSYKGSLDEVINEVKKEYGPLDEKLKLEDAAWLKGELFSVQILRDNYLQGDYVALISF